MPKGYVWRGQDQCSLKSLASAIDNLVGDVGDFDTKDWKEVVPEGH
jgi:hypothetical protein